MPVTSIKLRPDERAAADALAAEVGCPRSDLIRVALRWAFGRHPAEIRRRLADLPPGGKGIERARRPTANPADERVDDASRPDAIEAAREALLNRSNRLEDPTERIA